MRFTKKNYIDNIESRLGWTGRHVWDFYGLKTGTPWCAGEISYTFNKIRRKADYKSVTTTW